MPGAGTAGAWRMTRPTSGRDRPVDELRRVQTGQPWPARSRGAQAADVAGVGAGSGDRLCLRRAQSFGDLRLFEVVGARAPATDLTVGNLAHDQIANRAVAALPWS
jgi:hypothetical protein